MNLLTRLGLVATRSFMISPESKRPRLGVSSITPPLYNSLFSYSFSTTTTPTTQDSEEPISRKKLLPQELLSNNVVMLTCDSSAKGGLCHVYLVGTCHVLTESSKEVEVVISYLKPELVFLELCWNRRGYLTCQNLNLKVPTMKEKIELLKKSHDPLRLVLGWSSLSAANELGVIPGLEFRVAYEEAMKYGGKVMLGDRPIHITLQRMLGKMTLWQMIKLPFSLISLTAFLVKHIIPKMTSEKIPIWQKIMPISRPFQEGFQNPENFEKMLKDLMDDDDLLDLMMKEMNKKIPIVAETIVHERDLYMSSALLNTASKHSSIVAVVGKGHLHGIKKHWKQPVVWQDLLEIPSKKAVVSSAFKKP